MNVFKLCCGFVCVLVGLLPVASAEEPTWGNLKARFVYDGKPPEREKAAIDRDKDFCGMFDLRDESLIVDKEGGLANVVVWLDATAGAPPVHPDYAKSAKSKVTLDSRGCLFVPHIVTLRTSQTLTLRNADVIAHTTRFDGMANSSFNFLLRPEASFEQSLPRAERLPHRVACSIHPWRYAQILVQDHPYMAVSDARGHVELANLPQGKWTFAAWHERAGWLRSVEHKGMKVDWPKGRIQIDIGMGAYDLGVVKLRPDVFVAR